MPNWRSRRFRPETTDSDSYHAWNPQGETGAIIVIRLNTDRSPVGLGQTPGDGQAQPGAIGFGGEEWLEQTLQVCFGYDLSLIVNAYLQHLVGGVNIDSNRASLCGGIQCIVQQIDDYLLQPGRIGDQGEGRLGTDQVY